MDEWMNSRYISMYSHIVLTYRYEQISSEDKSHKPLGLLRDDHREATVASAFHQGLGTNKTVHVI